MGHEIGAIYYVRFKLWGQRKPREMVARYLGYSEPSHSHTFDQREGPLTGITIPESRIEFYRRVPNDTQLYPPRIFKPRDLVEEDHTDHTLRRLASANPDLVRDIRRGK